MSRLPHAVVPGLAPLLPALLVACGGQVQAPKAQAPASPAPSASPVASAPAPTPIPIVAPEIAPPPATCTRSAKTRPAPAAGEAPVTADVCKDPKAILHALATAGRAASASDVAGVDDALQPLQNCPSLPPLAVATLRAELGPVECAEVVLGPILDQQAALASTAAVAGARALVEASRLSRLRPTAHVFDPLARAEVDPQAAEAGTATVIAWKTALEKQEQEAAALSKGAPAELSAIVRFEAANAWLAFVHALRDTPVPDEIKSLSRKDSDLPTHYLAKLDEVTMPVVDHARQLTLMGLGIALRDGILIKEVPSFAPLLAEFRSRPGIEQRPTRDLELLMSDAAAPSTKEPDSATVAASTLPPWSVQVLLEAVAKPELVKLPVLDGLARHRGIPAAVRTEVEHDKKLDDTRRSALLLARTRLATVYDSRPDQEFVASASAKTPADRLRVAIGKALTAPKVTIQPSDPRRAPPPGYDLRPLDALAASGGTVGSAAAFDAALLSLESAQVFATPAPGDDSMPNAPPPALDPKRAYQDAIKRLNAVAARKDLSPTRRAQATALAQSATTTLDLLNKGARSDKADPRRQPPTPPSPAPSASH